MQDTLNIFVIETELQYLALLSIKQLVDNKSESIIFTTSQRVYERLCSEQLECHLVSRQSSGWIGRLIRIRKNLHLYLAAIKNKGKAFSQIHLHVPRIDNVHNNIAIHFLKYHFSAANISVRLIPDGAINIFSCALSSAKIRKQKRWAKNIGFRLFSDMNFMQFSGDELGADCDIVDKIYCFEGMETSYPQHKICNIRLPLTADSTIVEKNAALVIGQNFLQLKTASKGFIDSVSVKIHSLVDNKAVSRIDYAPHPRSEFNEFSQPSYERLEDDYLCIEEHIAKGDYKYVISCYSSALINSKIMFGDEINAVSVGLEDFPFPDKSQSNKLIKSYKKLGIEVIN